MLRYWIRGAGMPGNKHISDELELDLKRYQIRRSGRVLRLEKIPMELFIFLVENKDKLVSREAIVQHLWGKDVFVDTEQGINTAIRKIRQALQDDIERPRFLQTVVGKGYRFVGPVMVVDDEKLGALPQVQSSPATSKSEATATLAGGASAWWRSKRVFVTTILVLFSALALKYFDVLDRWLPRPAVRSIAVLPLKNLSGNAADDYFADGMTDELITNLAKISALRVTSYTSVSKYKATTKPLPQVADELHVDAIVEGSVVRAGEQVRITAQLIYAPRDQHLWAEEYQRYLRDVLYLQHEVARDIAQQIRVTLTPNEQSRLNSAGVVDPGAYESYLRGRSYRNQRSEAGLYKAIDQFNKAIEIDPGYAPAYSGIADCYTTLGYLSYLDPLDAFPRARDAATKAIDLDAGLAEAHASLAYNNLYHAWNWAEAEKEFKRAARCTPCSIGSSATN